MVCIPLILLPVWTVIMLQPSDRKYDKNQMPVMPGKNQPIGAIVLRRIQDMVMDLVKPGRGIRVERRGANVYVHVAQTGRGTGTSGGGGTTWMKTATTKAGLEEPVNEVYFGRVTAGADIGMVCVRNADNDGWDAFTHFE